MIGVGVRGICGSVVGFSTERHKTHRKLCERGGSANWSAINVEDETPTAALPGVARSCRLRFGAAAAGGGGIILVPVPSPAIEIWRPKLRMKDGQLAIEAYVFRQREAETTADSHFNLVFTDALERELMVDTTRSNPRSLPRAMRPPRPHAYLSPLVPISRRPPGTRAIEVRGHDGPHLP